MKVYRASRFGLTISEHEATGETKHTYTINGKKYRKRTSYDAYHPSYENAKAYLVIGAQEDFASATRELEIAKADLEKVKAL